MKKISLWFFLLTKRQLKNTVLVIFLIGLPICAFIAGLIPQMTENVAPRVGLVLEDEDELSTAVTQMLVNNDTTLDFYICDSAATLYQNIRNRDTECGYVFSKDLTEKLDSNSYKNCITLIKSPSNFVSSLSNEVVFSSLFRIYGKRIATNFIESSQLFKANTSDAVKMTEAKYDYYLNGSATFHIDFETLSPDGTAQKSTAIKATAPVFPIRGVLAITIFVAGLFGCIQWRKDQENGVFAPMSYSFNFSSRILYIIIPTLLFSASALATIYLSGVQVSLFTELTSMILYILLITAFCFVLSYTLRSSLLMVSLIPVLITGSLVLCPVFIDISTVFPVADILEKLFLPFYYLSWVR